MSGSLRLIDTTFGDAGWSRYGAHLASEDLLPVLERMDGVGFHAVEVLAPAHFAVHMERGGLSPWEHLRLARRALRSTPLLATLAGQSLVGRQGVERSARRARRR